MIENLLQKLIQLIYAPKLRKTEAGIGYKLAFRNIPDRFINGWVSYDETATWKKFGLDLEMGMNYWTIGKAAHGVSSRYERETPEYQSWLGGYLVKLGSRQTWTPEDHFKLAIADQNSWLRSYGDPKPVTTTEGWKFIPVDTIRLGQFSGTLYEFGCITDSDVGNRDNTLKLRLEDIAIASLFNLSNPNLHVRGGEMRPKISASAYEKLKLHGYIAIFDIEDNIKVVLYGNGAIVHNQAGDTDTFETLKNDLRQAMQLCEIVKT